MSYSLFPGTPLNAFCGIILASFILEVGNIMMRAKGKKLVLGYNIFQGNMSIKVSFLVGRKMELAF